MILEAIITTENEDGSQHLSAIGPHVNASLTNWTLKPFNTSKTFANLRRANRCVVHTSDDVGLLVASVTGRTGDIPVIFAPDCGYIISDACSFYALSLHDWEVCQPRSSVSGRVTKHQELRRFFGWNRAKHAILELAISATRIDLLAEKTILEQMEYAELMVDKTGGEQEASALQQLKDFMHQRLDTLRHKS